MTKPIHDWREKRRKVLSQLSDDDLRTLAKSEAEFMETNRPYAAALVDELVRRMRKS